MDGRNCYEMSDKLQTNYATLRFQAPQVAREQGLTSTPLCDRPTSGSDGVVSDEAAGKGLISNAGHDNVISRTVVQWCAMSAEFLALADPRLATMRATGERSVDQAMHVTPRQPSVVCLSLHPTGLHVETTG